MKREEGRGKEREEERRREDMKEEERREEHRRQMLTPAILSLSNPLWAGRMRQMRGPM